MSSESKEEFESTGFLAHDGKCERVKVKNICNKIIKYKKKIKKRERKWLITTKVKECSEK